MFVFFFNDTATTEIYTLSLHDALPISEIEPGSVLGLDGDIGVALHKQLVELVLALHEGGVPGDRKSTRLNSSHANISYAVFCLKKKTQHLNIYRSHRVLLFILRRFPLL